MTVREIQECRVCRGSDLKVFLDLGEHPMADAFVEQNKLTEPELVAPLAVCACSACGLIQLTHVVSAARLYDDSYIYESSVTRMGQRHWGEFASTAKSIAGLEDGGLVVDIGSNVGFLLEMFRARGAEVMGVDPAPVIVAIARERGIETMEACFDADVADRIREDRGQAKIITATNVFAHIDDLHGLMSAVLHLLEDDGVFIIEAPYVPNLIRSLEYDTIYHEHLSYLALRPVMALLESFGMEVFEVHQRDIHGGCFRCYIRRVAAGASPVSPIVDDLLRYEDRSGIYDHARLERFAAEVRGHREKLTTMLARLKDQDRRIAGVSAPAKGMTLLNYCGIGPETLEFITEKSALKTGRYSPGGRIPIVPDETLMESRPDYALILAWNFAGEIMENLGGYLQVGGKFILPIPEPHILG